MVNSATYRPSNIGTGFLQTRDVCKARDVIRYATAYTGAAPKVGVRALFSNPTMVKSGKLRAGTGSKLKRWKKGHSSDSNPQTSRFREAAKSRFFSRPTGKLPINVTRGSAASANMELATVSHLTWSRPG